MDSTFHTLRIIGLTQIEAQVYVCLAKKGPCNVRQLADALRLNAQLLHASLKNLESKGFVNQTNEVSAVFLAVPLEEILDNFVRTNLEQAQNLERLKARFSGDTNLKGLRHED